MLAEFSKKIFVPTYREMDEQRDWVFAKIEEVTPERIEEMTQRAIRIRERAYAPYSGYKVGATLLSLSGSEYDGCNQETVSFTGGRHAEGVAISVAIAEGEIEKVGRRFIDTLVICHTGNTEPCGECRQVMVEHADNCLVVNTDPDGNIFKLSSLKALLPDPFSPSNLGKE